MQQQVNSLSKSKELVYYVKKNEFSSKHADV